MEGIRIDLKTHWAWLCLTNTPKLSESKYHGDNFGPKSLKLHEYYCTIRLMLNYNFSCNEIWKLFLYITEAVQAVKN